MKTYLFTLSLLGLLSLNSLAQSSNQPTAGSVVSDRSSLLADLFGSWELDLRSSPNAPPYLTEATFAKMKGDSLVGSFYHTPFLNGKINTVWGKLYVAFTTSDGKNLYYTSGYVQDGKLYGMTLCEGRGFVMPWTGVKRK